MDLYDRGATEGGSDGAPDVELTAEEREGFARLPDEARPSDLLEERVVGALRSRGILSSRRGPSAGDRGAVDRRSSRSPWWRVPAAWAAGLVLFLGGGVVGHGVGARTTADAFLAVREQDAALRVQEAGTAYVSALMALEAMHDGSAEEPDADGRGAAQAREVASSTLLAAAHAYARLDPDDPFHPMLTALLEEQMQPPGFGERTQRTIWF